MRVQDFIPFVPPRHTVETAYAALSAVQDAHPGVQLAAIAVLFKEMAETADCDIPTLLNQAGRIVADDDVAFRASIKALREYVKQEIVK